MRGSAAGRNGAGPARHASNALLAASTLLVLAIAGFAALTISLLRDDALETASNHLENVAELHVRHASRTVQAIDVLLGAAVERAETLGLEDAARRWELHAILHRQAEAAPQIRALLVVDALGRAVVDSAALPPRPLQVEDRDYFLAHRDRGNAGLFIGQPIRGRLSNLWLIGMSRRISAPDGSFAGVVMASVTPDYFEEFLRPLPAGAESKTVLLHEDGKLLARHPPVVGEPGTSWADADANPDLPGSITQDDAEPLRNPFMAERHLMAFGRLPDYPLLLALATPERGVLLDWRRRATTVLAGALLSILAVGGVGLLSWRQSRKVESLVEALGAASHRADAATAATAAKSAFLANMSHELRNPLNAIVGFADALRGGHFGRLTAKQTGYIEDIHRAGQHLTALVGGVLDMSKIEAGRLDLEESDLSLQALVEGCVQLMLPQAEAFGVQVEAVNGRDDIWLTADELRLRQCLLNLLSNAIKFTPPQGRVAVEIEVAADGAPIISVSDTGIGMTVEELRSALEPFGQVREALPHRRHQGTGLGLPITEALVRLHGGQLQIDSAKGQGTIASIVLPAERLKRLRPRRNAA